MIPVRNDSRSSNDSYERCDRYELMSRFSYDNRNGYDIIAMRLKCWNSHDCYNSDGYCYGIVL